MAGADDDTATWFESLYAGAGGDWDRIPWAYLAPRPSLVAWLDEQPPAPGTAALVVACGLGDDAEELARRGCDVDAFDVAPTAIEAARRRFPGSPVRYRVADLFELPAAWREAFGLVVEVQTVQSLPPGRQADGIDAIAACVAPGGRLFVRAAVRGDDDPVSGPPWPVRASDLRRLDDAGLEPVWERGDDDGSGWVNVAYRRRETRGPLA
jgi:SAM-dependent methyltransferase